MEKLTDAVLIAAVRICCDTGMEYPCDGCPANKWCCETHKDILCELEDRLSGLSEENRSLTEKLKQAKDGRLELGRKYQKLEKKHESRSSSDLISRSELLTEIEENPWAIDIEELKAILKHVTVVEAEPVVHARWRWMDLNGDGYSLTLCCSNCLETRGVRETMKRCPECGAHMDEQLELRTCYCPICDKHFEVRSNDSSGDCPDCGHHVVLSKVEGL